MANIFDIDVKLSGGKDQNVDTHLLNEQFHVFSKSPSSAATSLGSASNRSGHTVTATDVWAEEIPAFYEVPDMNSTASLNANENDLCRVGNGVAIYKNGAWSLEYASYMDIPDGHEFVNASGKPVIRFHKNRLARNLTVKNNAADDGLNSSAKIQGWDKDAQAPYEYVEAAPKFVSQFVTSTDKIVDGKPSKGYGPFVMAGTTTGDITKVLNEGTVDDNDYVANSFAGIIQYNKKRTDAIYVHAFEYCGHSLKTAYSDIEELDEKLSKISVTASGGVQAVSDAAKSAGLEIDAVVSDGVTTPTLDIQTGSITTGETKLVTGGAVKTYVDTTALAEGGSIAKAIADYVATNAKVSVNGQSATTITVAGTAAGAADLVKVVVTEDKSTENKIGLTLTATLDAAVLNDDGSIKEDGVVIATIAKDIAEKVADTAITNAITTDNGAIKDAIEGAISDATLNSGTQGDNQIQTATGDAANKLVTAAQVKEYVTENAQVTVTVGSSKKTSTGFEFAGSTGTDIAVAPTMDANGKVTYSATLTKATIDSSTGAIKNNSGNFVVSASDAEKIAIAKAQAEIEAAVGTGEIIDSHISDVLAENTATLETSGAIKNGDDDKFITAKDAQTLAQNAANAIDTGIMSIDSTKTNGIGLGGGSSADSVKVFVTPATYTKKSGSTPGSWSSESLTSGYFTTAQSVSDAIADAVGAIVIPKLVLNPGTENYGFYLSSDKGSGAISNHYLGLATASYTPASGDTAASWTNKGYLVTGSTVEQFVGAEVGKVAEDLSTLESKVNAYHEAGVSYKVYDKTVSSEADLPDLTVPGNIEAYKNVILLVPTSSKAPGSQHETPDESEAISGGYIEYLCVKTGETTYAWEKIGTTEADLSGYVRGIRETNKADSHTSPVYASISTTGYLSLGIDSATSDKLGVSKLFSGNYWQLPATTVTDAALSTKTASEMFTNIGEQLAAKANASEVVKSINGVKGAVNICVHNAPDYSYGSEGNGMSGFDATTHANLWGMGFAANPHPSNDEDIILVDSFIGMSGSYLTTANLPSDAVSVENNFVYDSQGRVITTIRPERMVRGFGASIATGLKSFVGDLNNLETSSTFYNHTAIETFIGDLSSLKEGSQMFCGCSSLTTFIGDLSSLEIGTGSLSTDASGMFQKTALTVESVENIADALPENPEVSTSATNKGCIAISWKQLTSVTAERQELVDALSGVLDKGWVLVTNSELLTMFNTEKYQVVQQTVQPLDLEGEPQEIAYVIKK